MKKDYIKPAIYIQEVHLERMLALSTVDGYATEEPVLIKEQNEDWNIWEQSTMDDEDWAMENSQLAI